MAHSHEQTYIAKLGFADPDKRESRHDLAQRYLSIDENLMKIARPFIDSSWVKDSPGACFGVKEFSVEVPVSKGRDQYKTTVGFLDVTFNTRIAQKSGDYIYDFTVALEVKVSRIPVTDIIRQIKFYKEYTTIRTWGIVTLYDLSADEVAALTREKIKSFRLGVAFDLFCENVRIENDVNDPFAELALTI